MGIYLVRDNNVNQVAVSEQVMKQVHFGIDAIWNIISKEITKRTKCCIAFDGWYGINWNTYIDLFRQKCSNESIKIECYSAANLFLSKEQIEEYKQPFLTDDPAFGWENRDGKLSDLLDNEMVAKFGHMLESKQFDSDVLIIYGVGAACESLLEKYDLVIYFDKMIQKMLPDLWDGKLVPIGFTEPKSNYGWKEYYYCDYHLLIKQKLMLLSRLDYYVDCANEDDETMLSGKAYQEIVSVLAKQPMKQIETYQGGPWGAYRYKQLENVEGLECNAWHSLVKGDSPMEIDIGAEKTFFIPFPNMHQFANQIIGPYIANMYPLLFPIVMSLDDGWFPEPVPPYERISMPMHSHPSSDYARRNFNEYWGRYESYYIVEAYKDAGTWLGYQNDADLEEWERKCRESENEKVIDNWQEYVKRWDSNVGDLYLIPPGTVHGHGGNQMVLEMDTYPTIAGNEYSFFIYDFARNSWDDTTKTMTGKPMKMHTEHAFANEHWQREDYVNAKLRAKPKVIEAKDDYSIVRYSSIPEMPFDIDRMDFYGRGVYDTQNKYMHLVTLVKGSHALIRSLNHPERQAKIVRYHAAIVPAEFGAYEVLTEDGGCNSVTIFHLKKG